MISCIVQEQLFDAAAETEKLCAGRTDIGAIVSFTGLVRDIAGGASVEAMTLEHYPGMTERQLELIAREAIKRWPVISGRVIHRFGRLLPGDPIVLVIITSAHREAAFEAAWFIMDWLKTKAPFWKLEEGDGEAKWVDAKEDDEKAMLRWKKD
ncbi:MAG: molybdenum cofactor biosynthesis protein MoaE [Sphingomonadales bacterium]|jgi:molybdopterin synthase catalytic subunit